MASIGYILAHSPTRFRLSVGSGTPASLSAADVPQLLAAAAVAGQPGADSVLCPRCAAGMERLGTLTKLSNCYKPCARCGSKTIPPRKSFGTARLQTSADNL